MISVVGFLFFLLPKTDRNLAHKKISLLHCFCLEWLGKKE